MGTIRLGPLSEFIDDDQTSSRTRPQSQSNLLDVNHKRTRNLTQPFKPEIPSTQSPWFAHVSRFYQSDQLSLIPQERSYNKLTKVM